MGLKVNRLTFCTEFLRQRLLKFTSIGLIQIRFVERKRIASRKSGIHKWTITSASVILSFTHTFGLEIPKPLSVQIEPRAGENFAYGVFQCWLPKSGTAPESILCIILHPRDQRAMVLADPEPWMQLANKYDCSLVAASFVASSDSTKPWGKALLGSGRALQSALNEFSKASGYKEIRSAPMVLAGVCEAGQYAHEFSALEPNRTAAFVTIGGGQHNLQIVNETSRTRGLFVVCDDRGESAVKNMLSLFREGRQVGAPWELTVESIKDYDTGTVSAKTLTFLEAILTRAPEEFAPSINTSDGKLHPARGRPRRDPSRPMKNMSWRSVILEGKHPSPRTNWSMLSNKIPRLASIVPAVISLGPLPLRETARVEFSISTSSEEVVEISLGNSDQLHNTNIEKMSTNCWEVKGSLDLSAYPTGAFRIEIPIRFLGQSGGLIGGEMAIVCGTVRGDVVPSPKYIHLGSVESGLRATTEVSLESESGSPVEILEVSSDSAEVDVNVLSRPGAGQKTIVELGIAPSKLNRDGGFSGNILLKVQSSEIRVIKLFFYGDGL